MTFGVNENVFRFEVVMNDAEIVEVLKAENLAKVKSAFALLMF